MCHLRYVDIFFGCAALGFSQIVMAQDTVFNPALLEIDHPMNVDIRQFDRQNALQPGEYKVDVFINDRLFESRTISFVQDAAGATLHPCFVDVKEALRAFGVKVDALKSLTQIDEKQCRDPEPLIPGSQWVLDGEKLALRINIPQLYLDLAARDYIPPSRWDEGINALMVNYDFSGSKTLRSDYQDDDYYYLNLQNGLNLGAWRLRNYSTLNTTDGQASYHSVSSYIQRDIAALRSQIMLGDAWTASDIFDSAQIRGIRLYTDADMLPDSMNGFAPTVRGIAKSNATVIIRQSGYVIYQSAVPQGAFEITDLSTANTGGDLDVTVKEEDGSEQHFTQPYASLAILKREGQTDVDFSVGELRAEDHFTPNVAQGQILHGLPWGMTIYGGAQLANDYRALALGVGKDLGALGALSFDVTHAHAYFAAGDDETGQSYRFLYSKRFDETDTNFRLVGYRYSTKGYYTLNEWASRQNDASDFWVYGNRRSRVEGTWTQNFGQQGGNVYITLSRQQYWQTDEVERLVQMGYSNTWHRVSWSISWNYSDSLGHYSTSTNTNNSNASKEQIYMFTVSVPLSGWMDGSYVDYSLNQDNHGNSTHSVGLGGSLLEGRNLSWNLQQSYDNSGSSYNGNMSLAYDGTYGSVNGAYAWSQETERFSYGVKGGVMLHGDGITLSQELGETVALVQAPGAEGLKVENTTGVATDWQGYTVKTQLTPYDENRVAIDSDYFSQANVELDNTVVNVVPTRGAVVKAAFTTHVGYRILFDARLAGGKAVPFGAIATAQLDSGVVTGIVGDNGELYLAGMPEKGDFQLVWGEGGAKRCHAAYQVDQQGMNGLIQVPVTCQ
ncbi:fimbria/pilus outer membrane usher protein [Citrobacter sp. Igbk 14]|uniref:fimbria/pilus outer membrane usher protein n=1 Tax=Citrobacter sp. Igbk 14 TaxID=2963960 RepID=UPI002303096B|nr:fimbria/pilus outer membrane usher protein [Citrobacter sp. Igbk 14]MDA8512532.1 fimbrial biogenesis outer membrane usher protein [Citrobacter sp. Igbk 14]